MPSRNITEPVVLLHGTSNNASVWGNLVHLLQDQGACVWAFDYGADDVTVQNMIPSVKAIADLDDSAAEIADQVDYVREVTGSDKVNLVGHSQGGMHIKTYTQMHGGAGHVSHAVALGGNFHGTTLNGQGETLSKFIAFAPHLAAFLASTAGIQQVVGSEFMKRLNALPDTAPGVLYTSIYSPGDTTVTPNSSSQLALGDGADVVNLDLGEVCGVAPRHDKLPTNWTVLSQVIFGLKRAPGERPDSSTCVSGGADKRGLERAASPLNVNFDTQNRELQVNLQESHWCSFMTVLRCGQHVGSGGVPSWEYHGCNYYILC